MFKQVLSLVARVGDEISFRYQCWLYRVPSEERCQEIYRDLSELREERERDVGHSIIGGTHMPEFVLTDRRLLLAYLKIPSHIPQREKSP